MNIRPVLFTVLFFSLLFPRISCGFTLYLKEYVITAEAKLTIGDITLPGHGNELPVFQASLQELPYSAAEISIIPAAQVKALVAAHYPGSLVVIGQHTAVIPEKLLLSSCQSFLFQFIQYAASLRKSREYRMDIRFLQPVAAPGDCPGNVFRFTLPSLEKTGELFPGSREITCTDSAGREILLKVFIKQSNVFPGIPAQVDNITPDTGNTFADYRKTGWKAKEVRAGDTVTIYYLKGNIRLKMDGLAYSSGAAGEVVSVKASTTNKRFKGIVTGRKEVSIEIP